MSKGRDKPSVAATWIERLARVHACNRCGQPFRGVDLGAVVIRSHCRIWPVDGERPHLHLTFDCSNCDSCVSLDLDLTIQQMGEALATIYERQMRHHAASPPLVLKLRG